MMLLASNFIIGFFLKTERLFGQLSASQENRRHMWRFVGAFESPI
jgi:hypothetical protein